MPENFAPRPAPETVIQFGPIRFIPGRKGGRYPYCHSLVLEGEETWVVDPAADKDYFRELARTRSVTRVFLSHFHEDHQKYNHLFPAARFYVPAAEEAAFTSLEGIFRLMGIQDQEFRNYWQATLLKDFHYRPLTRYSLYQPGQRFETGGIILEILAAPGHTPGHSCFHFPRQDLLFLADVDLAPFGPWYGDAASVLEDYEVTLERLARFQARTYLTAHEQGVFSPEEFQAGIRYFQQVVARRDAALLAALVRPQSLAQLAARRLIYRKPKEPAFVYGHMERQMVQKHLARLSRLGLVREEGGSYHAA